MDTPRHRRLELFLGYAALCIGAFTLATIGEAWSHFVGHHPRELPVPADFYLRNLSDANVPIAILALLLVVPISLKAKIAVFAIFAMSCLIMILSSFICLCRSLEPRGEQTVDLLMAIAAVVVLIRLFLRFKRRKSA